MWICLFSFSCKSEDQAFFGNQRVCGNRIKAIIYFLHDEVIHLIREITATAQLLRLSDAINASTASTVRFHVVPVERSFSS